MDFKRLEGENYHQYIWRLDGLIQSGKYKNWKEITPMVNKELFGDEEDKYRDESAYRKSVKYARDFFEAGVFGIEDDYAKELEEQRRALTIERNKLAATKVEYNREIRHYSRFELFYENIAKTITTLEKPEFVDIDITEDTDNCYVLTFSDLHYGATYSSENNTYSREECKRRFEYLYNYMIRFVINNNVQKLKILNGADSIQGILRMSDLQINDTDVVMCVVEISQIISEFLNKLSKYCSIEYYHVCQANHAQTRNLGSKASELAGEDLEKIIANYINDVLKDNERINVIFNMDKEYVDFKIFDFECTVEHGHRVKNINNYLKDKSILRRKMYDYAFLGHTHSSKELIVGEHDNHNLEVLVIPSVCGSDPYSDKLNVGSKAMAKIFKFNSKYGHIGSENIILN